jgi:hypothetical protein
LQFGVCAAAVWQIPQSTASTAKNLISAPFYLAVEPGHHLACSAIVQ